jgi:hypothetical protein
MGTGLYSVYESATRKFLYYDPARDPDGTYKYPPPTKRHSMPFPQFVDFMNGLKTSGTSSMCYLQQMLSDTVGPDIVQVSTARSWPVCMLSRAAIGLSRVQLATRVANQKQPALGRAHE